jgi:signal transduction histidine kinase
MNRRILLQVTAPAAVIGLLVFVTCLVSAWFVGQLQINRWNILSENVTSLEAAGGLEIDLRRLRFLCFLYLIDPSQPLLEEITTVNDSFQRNLEMANHAAFTAKERQLVEEIKEGYDRYQREFHRVRAEVARSGPRRNFRELADSNPIRHVVDPCDQLLEINKEMINQTSQDSDRLSHVLLWVLMLLGLGGPLSGLLVGFGVARGLSRSIYQLRVRVQDVAQRLDQDVGSVSVAGDGDLQALDRQLQQVVQRVEEVARRLQLHQQEALRAQQLSAVGQLAASVAHEVRNPLTSIKMLVESALHSRNRRPLTIEDLQVIHGEVDRLEHTVQSFLDFARLPRPRRTPCDLRDIIAQAVDLVRVRARQQQIEITCRCPESPVMAHLDANQIGNVLINLCLNALDAMPQGGRLDLSLESDGARGICLSVCDSGNGIDPDMLARLFTPFASTKPTGSGLGLSISQRIIEEHGGRIAGNNRSEGGACFTIHLPARRQEPNHVDIAGDR